MTAFQTRRDLCQAWGLRSPWEARALFAEAAGDPDAAPATPALAFADKAGYLEARAAWRARQRTIEAQIRALKAARRQGGWQERADAASEAAAWGVLAHAALLERALQKKRAGAQWAQARAAAAA